jgi:Leucine-rich repeat (LRR) protein
MNFIFTLTVALLLPLCVNAQKGKACIDKLQKLALNAKDFGQKPNIVTCYVGNDTSSPFYHTIEKTNAKGYTFLHATTMRGLFTGELISTPDTVYTRLKERFSDKWSPWAWNFPNEVPSFFKITKLTPKTDSLSKLLAQVKTCQCTEKVVSDNQKKSILYNFTITSNEDTTQINIQTWVEEKTKSVYKVNFERIITSKEEDVEAGEDNMNKIILSFEHASDIEFSIPENTTDGKEIPSSPSGDSDLTGVFQFTKTILDLSSKNLTEIPPSVFKQTELKKLYLHNNKLTKIPIEIGNLTNLNHLELFDNQLTNIPTEIEKWTNLTYLGLGNNQLTNIPVEIENLTNLTTLNLHNNKFTKTPVEIWKLISLTVLDLSDNQLASIPADIEKLSNLGYLNLSNIQLTSIPPEIWQLTSLYNLKLFANQLTSVSGEIENLSNLAILHLDNNQLMNIPTEIGNLSNLVDLHLNANQLASIPPEIGNLTNLKNLDLDSNQLTSIPSEIGNLTNLKDLDLDSNQLTSIPSEIGNLTNLVYLHLEDNQLTTLPDEIEKLTQLHTLHLSNNPISYAEQQKIKKLLPNCYIYW